MSKIKRALPEDFDPNDFLDGEEYLVGKLSECCDAPINERGFCFSCGEHAS